MCENPEMPGKRADFMKFDMHCHTNEGSVDGKVPVVQYAAILKNKGFGGMLVSDHNSYNGYRAWRRYQKRAKAAGRPGLTGDFVVLKGIEYDTIDAGHMLVIMPTGAKLPILEFRGLPVQLLIEIVHRNGGILGPAHPCGEKYLSITNTRKHRHQLFVMDKFDFVEGFNACESPESNRKAMELAEDFNKPTFGGSDAHKADCIGLGYADFDSRIHSESELIRYLKEQGHVACGGEYYNGTTKEKLGKANKVLVHSFWLYNYFGSLWQHHHRKLEISRLRYENSRRKAKRMKQTNSID